MSILKVRIAYIYPLLTGGAIALVIALILAVVWMRQTIIYKRSVESRIHEKGAEQYDAATGQQPVLSRKEINDILEQFESVSYPNLDPSYHSYSDPAAIFSTGLQHAKFRIVRGRDIYKFIVGKIRVRSFLSIDKYHTANTNDLDANRGQFWLVDENLLYLILDFMILLESEGYDRYGYYVRESHRHPKNNFDRGGSSQSLHIYGKAADLVIQDINRDGDVTTKDKEICLEILEKLIGDKGGMGLYPGTNTIHIDTRGHRARWNSYRSANK